MNIRWSEIGASVASVASPAFSQQLAYTGCQAYEPTPYFRGIQPWVSE
jgi:hypothetical protein